jgi:hypothetical protein
MKKTITFGTLVMMLLVFFTTSLRANEVCNLIEECQELKAKVDARLLELLKELTPALTEVLKKNVSQANAQNICANLGHRLPTVREFAMIAQLQGAQGISQTYKPGYTFINGLYNEGAPDPFFYSHRGYRPTSSDLAFNFYWTSSIHPNDPRYSYSYFAESGEFIFEQRNNSLNMAVRCVQTK